MCQTFSSAFVSVIALSWYIDELRPHELSPQQGSLYNNLHIQQYVVSLTLLINIFTLPPAATS